MLHVSPFVFKFILLLIKDHPVFSNNANTPQTPVDFQLAVTLYCLGHFWNAASLEDVAWMADCSEGPEGAVEKYTKQCFEAIKSLHDIFVWRLTDDEKEKEKQWMDHHLGFCGLWHEGYLMYDGTIVVLYEKPGKNGDAYYTHKANYGLNIGNMPSNLCIIDYCHGFTGSAHDAAAFEHTCAFKNPDWLFHGEEFAWADSAYTLSPCLIPVHCQPASFVPENAID